MSFRLQSETMSTERSLSRDTAVDAKSKRDAAEHDEAMQFRPEVAQRTSATESLNYLIELTFELKQLANLAGFNRLGLILMLAEQEARQQLSKSSG